MISQAGGLRIVGAKRRLGVQGAGAPWLDAKRLVNDYRQSDSNIGAKKRIFFCVDDDEKVNFPLESLVFVASALPFTRTQNNRNCFLSNYERRKKQRILFLLLGQREKEIPLSCFLRASRLIGNCNFFFATFPSVDSFFCLWYQLERNKSKEDFFFIFLSGTLRDFAVVVVVPAT